MRIVATIQARMGSSRFPGKVLMEINDKPMLYWLVDRVRKSRLIDEVIIATTTSKLDDEIVKFCEMYAIKYFRGSEDDVLLRIASLIKKYKIDIHVELFGDSPLVDPHLIDEFLGYLLKNYDYLDFVSNSIKTTYPPGQEVLVYKGESLIKADNETPRNDPLREHVSIHIYKHPDKYRVENLIAPQYYNYPNIYLEVDTREDFYLISKIFHHFFAQGKEYFSLSQILEFLNSNTELIKINNKVPRRWKEFRENNE